MADPYGREVGRMTDLDGMTVILGLDYDSVTIHAGTFTPGGGIRLESLQADEFAQLYSRACWEAGAQAARLEADRA